MLNLGIEGSKSLESHGLKLERGLLKIKKKIKFYFQMNKYMLISKTNR